MIRQVSVDDRLLHGQVAFYWTSYYNLDMILVLNDEAANDEFTKMILGLREAARGALTDRGGGSGL